jgi:ArsR family transcriptional regulator, arsenate/arsenite/antimonite-responsive transcriptional repressor
MGITKSDHFTFEQNEMALIFKALGHPARIAIVEFLRAQKKCICGDIVNELPLSQPTISQHLKELKNANIIQGTIEGASVCYCLNLETILKIENYLSLMKSEWCMSNEKCC